MSASATPCWRWDALVLLAAVLDGMRLPRADGTDRRRSWTNAPALDSETEIELTVENHGRVIVECRLVDDLPPALVESPAHAPLTAFPRVPAIVRYRVEPQERGDCGGGLALCALSLAAGAGGALGQGAARHRRCASIRRCAPARSSRSFWRAAGRSICNCARRGSADWAATSRACANTARATTCATSAGRRRRGAAARSRANTRPSAASRCGSCSTADG